jgi:hypothetical protein
MGFLSFVGNLAKNVTLDIGSLITGLLGVGQSNKDREFAEEQAVIQQQQWQQSYDLSLSEQKRQTEQWNENMDWQKYLASNSYQLKAADMRAAGLNPVLAAGGGTISSPPISSGVVSHPGTSGVVSRNARTPDFRGSMSVALSGLGDLARQSLRSEINQNEAAVDYTEAQASLAREQAAKVRADTTQSSELHPGRIILQYLDIDGKQLDNAQTAAETSRILTDNAFRQLQLKQEPERFRSEMLTERQSRLLSVMKEQQILKDIESISMDITERGLRMSVLDIEKAILAHDADIFLASNYPSTSTGASVEIDHWVTNAFPGMDKRSRGLLGSLIRQADALTDKMLQAFKPTQVYRSNRR